MNNKYVSAYCDHFNLKIISNKVPGENFIIEKGNHIGFFRDDSKYVEFNNSKNEYKKSDLLNFILENLKAH